MTNDNHFKNLRPFLARTGAFDTSEDNLLRLADEHAFKGEFDASKFYLEMSERLHGRNHHAVGRVEARVAAIESIIRVVDSTSV